MVPRHLPFIDDDDNDDVRTAPSTLVDYERVFVELYRAREEDERALVDSLAPMSRLDFLTDATGAYRETSARMTGRGRLMLLQEALAAFDVAIQQQHGTSGRSADQRWFHRKMTIAVLPLLFGDELDVHLESLQREFGFVEIRKELLVITPRRHGKTWSVAMFCAAYAYAMGPSEQAIFSTGRRASEALLDRVYQFYSKTPGFSRANVIKNNQENLWIRGSTPNDIRKISSYPSKVEIRYVLLCVCVCVRVQVVFTGTARTRAHRSNAPTVSHGRGHRTRHDARAHERADVRSLSSTLRRSR